MKANSKKNIRANSLKSRQKSNALNQETIDLDKELKNLENNIKKLRVMYEQFFMNVLKIPPQVLNNKVNEHIKKLKKYGMTKAAHKFKLNDLESRFRMFSAYWKKTLREKENGTYKKDLFRKKMNSKSSNT